MLNLKSYSDEDLVEYVIKKEKEAYGELVKRYQEKLLRYANYLLQDEHMAEDVVQESFIKAFVNLKGFNTKRVFSSWIYRIVHNEAINKIRKDKRKISLDTNSWIKETFHSGEDIEADFEKEETVKMVRSCIKKLSLNYRSPLTLYYLEGKSYEEISEILKMPINTVGTRIRRGKKRLAEICERKK
jgi:RNA polymerase sigma-70 factor (ECF subfamily)